MEETGTIYAAKVDIYATQVAGGKLDFMKVEVGLHCKHLDASTPSYRINNQVDNMNGFHVVTLCAQLPGSVTAGEPVTAITGFHQKFRFRRKCDRDDRVELFAARLVVNGSSAACIVFGSLELIIRMR